MGAGHNSAVKALQEAVETHYPDQFEQEVIDVVSLIGPTLDKVAASIYEKTVMYSKLTYKAFFEFSDKSEIGTLFDKIGYPLIKPGLKPIIDAKPDLIISCFPFLSYSVSKYLKQKRYHVPLAALITDTGEVHSTWICDRIDCYFSPTVETSFYLIENGIKKDNIKTFGFPVRQTFYQKYDKKAARLANDFPLDKPIILYFSGVWGSGKVKTKVEEMDKVLKNVCIVVVCGKNEKLKAAIKAKRYRNKVITVGMIKNVAEVMAAADLLVSKAGGLSTMEAITMKKPVVITEIVPGQEQPNARFIETMGFGYVEKDPEELARRVKYILESGDLARMEENYARYHLNENSDKKIADQMVSLIEHSHRIKETIARLIHKH